MAVANPENRIPTIALITREVIGTAFLMGSVLLLSGRIRNTWLSVMESDARTFGLRPTLVERGLLYLIPRTERVDAQQRIASGLDYNQRMRRSIVYG